MQWVRKSFVGLLSLVLLSSLLVTAFSVSFVLNLRQPSRIESWLSDSKVYDHFVSSVIDQSRETTRRTSAPGEMIAVPAPATDAAIKQAAEQAFSAQLLQQSTETFIRSNYAWLEGKTTTPDFTIDLTAAKMDFANRVGEYIRQSSAKLPVCTSTELAILQGGARQGGTTQETTVDPLTASCRPATVTPEAMAAETTARLSTSDDFLSNPVITAKTLNPRDNKGGSRPYYVKLAKLPQAYQASQKLPLVTAAVVLLSGLGIVLLSSKRRKGWQRVSLILILAGGLLIAVRFAADAVLQRLQHRVFNPSSEGQLQNALIDFVHRVESALVRTDFWFGIICLALAVGIIIALLKTRATPATNAAFIPAEHETHHTESPLPPSPANPQHTAASITPSIHEPIKSKPNAVATVAEISKPSRPKPPRLIQ